MPLKSFLFISLIAHTLLFIDLQGLPPSDTSPKVEIQLEERSLFSEKTLTTRAKEKQNTKPTKRPNNSSKSTAPPTYQEEFIRYIQSKATYPRSALSLKQEGTVVLKVTLFKNGTVASFKIIKKSNFSALNSAALNLLKGVTSYRPLPKNLKSPQTFNIPINYILN